MRWLGYQEENGKHFHDILKFLGKISGEYKFSGSDFLTDTLNAGYGESGEVDKGQWIVKESPANYRIYSDEAFRAEFRLIDKQ